MNYCTQVWGNSSTLSNGMVHNLNKFTQLLNKIIFCSILFVYLLLKVFIVKLLHYLVGSGL
jgi:hypothetical protein